MPEQDSLGLFLHWKAERRKDDEARLKRLGLTWKQLDQLEGEAVSQIPPEGVNAEGFHFVLGKRTNRILPEEVAKKYTAITESFITIH